MKALLQRVSRASVAVSQKITGRIDQGLVALVGVSTRDTEMDAQYLAQKTANLRIFSDEEGRFNLSATDVNGAILVVSQFTLLADTHKGRRPSFTHAALPQVSEKLIDVFIAELRAAGLKVETGRFQQHMLVEIHNDGPVTIMLDSRDKF